METNNDTSHMARGALVGVAEFMLFLLGVSLISVFYLCNLPDVGYAVVDLLLPPILVGNGRIKTVVLKCSKMT